MREPKARAVVDHLHAQACQQTGEEQEHDITEGDGGHRDERAPGIAPQVAPGDL